MLVKRIIPSFDMIGGCVLKGEEHVELFQGLPCCRITLPCGDSVLVALHGAHVLSWTSNGTERLYLSPCAHMDGRSAIRGGVPICFPQFNQRGNLPRHGFARNMAWTAEPATFTGDAAQLQLTLRANDATRAIWPQEFVATLTLDLQPGSLQITLSVQNTDAKPVTFSGALHTYLAVDDIAHTQLTGLQGQAEWDAVCDVHGTAAEVLRFDGEFDRVYAASGRPLTLQCGQKKLTIAQSSTWAQHVVWNPGAERCAKLADMPADGYAHMLCVEAAQVYEPIAVAAGQTWHGWQRLVSTIEAC
jgi:glucose-6-phosphate 1-epimerase